MDRAAERNIPDAAVARVAAVLSTFDASRPTQRVSDISRRSGLPMSTTSRLLTELVHHELLTRTAAGLQIGPLLAATGRLAPVDLPALAAPHLSDLAAVTGLTAHLAALAGSVVTCLAARHPHPPPPPLCSAHKYSPPCQKSPVDAEPTEKPWSDVDSPWATQGGRSAPAASSDALNHPENEFPQVGRGVSICAQSKGGCGVGVGSAHACAAGKVLLAAEGGEGLVDTICAKPLGAVGPRTITDARRLRRELARIRGCGLAYDCEESGRGIGGLAVAVRGTDCALAVVGAVNAVDPRSVGPALRVAARALEREAVQSRT